ncbi:hypothetical protein ALP22_200234 [Pseudomonas coronafaciens pv. porri]|nr:hypothetical protein ALP22_200234 [Pseudomonas coronafaciens pv. porri]
MAEGQISEFIQYHQVCAQQCLGDSPCLAIVLLTLQQIHQIHRGKEAHAFVVGRDSGYSQGTGQVCFPGSRAADEHDILRGFSERQAG